MTSTALICGLGAANTTKPVIVSALLIAAFADNLTDTLSVHIFQESEQLAERDALTGTMTNFVTRLLLCISFVPLVAWLPLARATTAAVVWGALLLATLTYLVARERKVGPVKEIVEHLLVAAAAVIASILIGHWIGAELT